MRQIRMVRNPGLLQKCEMCAALQMIDRPNSASGPPFRKIYTAVFVQYTRQAPAVQAWQMLAGFAHIKNRKCIE